MTARATTSALPARPAPSAVLELLKPITWFAPMWAFGCGLVSAGGSIAEHWPLVIVGILLAGPMVCGTSQAVNDWFDRHVDAINEPNRPYPQAVSPADGGSISPLSGPHCRWRFRPSSDHGALRPRALGLRSPGLTARRLFGSSRMVGGATQRLACAMRACPGSRLRSS